MISMRSPGNTRGLTVCFVNCSLGSTTKSAGCHRDGSTKPTLNPSQLPLRELGRLFVPMSTSRTGTRSFGDFAIAPKQSKAGEMPATPLVLLELTVHLRPYKPALVVGWTTEPSVSVPIATGLKPAATPTALPADDPHGVYKGEHQSWNHVRVPGDERCGPKTSHWEGHHLEHMGKGSMIVSMPARRFFAP